MSKMRNGLAKYGSEYMDYIEKKKVIKVKDVQEYNEELRKEIEALDEIKERWMALSKEVRSKAQEIGKRRQVMHERLIPKMR